MSGPGPSHAAELAEIEAARKKLKSHLEATQRQLAWVEKNRVPESQPYISFKRVDRIEDLAGKAVGIRVALKADIQLLKNNLKNLRAEAARVRKAEYAENVRRETDAAKAADRRFEARAKAVLNAAVAKGAPDAAELAELQAGAEAVLRQYTKVLKDHPSEKAAKEVLDQIAETMALGSGDGGGAQEEAFEVLGEASRKLLEDAKRRFANAPGPKAMKDLMRSVANLAFLGGDDGAAGAAVDQVVPFVEAQKDRAEAAFRRSPTTANLRKMSDAEAGCVAMGGRPLPDPPKELRRVKPGKTHELAAGETLAGIASRYYGNSGFWDVLVRHNPGVLTDPDHPPVGKTIQIPW